MRVIAGRAGGIRLDVPRSNVRPTMDRVKAAIFSSLGNAVVGARVLDLFAGTGALGIEALSRGAASVLFVEQDAGAIIAIERNLAHTKSEGQIRKQDVMAFLRSTRTIGPFDIIFADPPYEKTLSGEVFTALLLEEKKLASLLAPDGIFVLEKRPSEKMPSCPLWNVIRARRYGATEVLFLQHANDPVELKSP